MLNSKLTIKSLQTPSGGRPLRKTSWSRWRWHPLGGRISGQNGGTPVASVTLAGLSTFTVRHMKVWLCVCRVAGPGRTNHWGATGHHRRSNCCSFIVYSYHRRRNCNSGGGFHRGGGDICCRSVHEDSIVCGGASAGDDSLAAASAFLCKLHICGVADLDPLGQAVFVRCAVDADVHVCVQIESV